jgi:hypothetical protein
VTACGCCTGTIGACTEGCCCAACNPAPGGRTRDAREEIARALTEELDGLGLTPGSYYAEHVADAVLAVPAVADALALRERVEALADRLEISYRRLPEDAGATLAASLIREALDGPP